MSSSETDDDFVKYGTPLEPLEEDEIPSKKPCLLEDQIVRDKQGRRRFHGAFTGGFSAGFFNSVGSLEGWKPSSFKSSKNEKHKVLHQKPEDYMDEEDLGEFGIAPLVLQTKSDYQNLKKKSVHFTDNGTNLGAFVFHNLLKPIRETVGVKLLMKMGWKAGQGIGPRTKKSEKKKILKFKQKALGCNLNPEFLDEEESDSDSDLADITYAPTDYEPYLFSSKDNFFGIGYQGLQKNSVLGSLNQTNYREKILPEAGIKKLNVVGQAFGVGAFEDEDEDIYAKDDLSQYDFSLASDNYNQEDKLKIIPKTEGVLEGFTPQLKKCINIHRPLPLLPKNFNGQHSSEISTCKKIEEKKNFPQTEKLGSQKFDVLTEGDIKSLSKNKCKNETIPECFTTSPGARNHYHFKPFCFDPIKQERFEKYLKLLEAKKKDELSSLQPLTMTDWDKEREKLDFDQAAKMLIPLSGILENRFQPARQTEDLSDPLAVVEKFSDENEDCKKAAKMKMFGPLTRKIENWTPCQLLSKRFNIPELKKRCDEISRKKEKDCKTLFDCTDWDERTKKIVDEMPVKVPTAVIQEGINENNEKPNPIPATQDVDIKNKVDLYKEIFLASDDEEEKVNLEKEEISYEEQAINKNRNTSPPRGIFENIELKTVSKCKKIDETINVISDNKLNASNENSMAFNADVDVFYGPKIPEKIEPSVKHHFIKNVVDDCNWVEKSISLKKHKKKSKKSKKSKHKSSRKKK